MTTVRDIARAIEKTAPVALQESWDNSGLQLGVPAAPVTGVMLTLDVTTEAVDHAINTGCNLIVSHHPLIFKGLKSITDTTDVQMAVRRAIRADIAVYSAHTSLDNAPEGPSAYLASALGATIAGPLVPTAPGAATGTGVTARLPHPMTAQQFIAHVKNTLGPQVIRCTAPDKAPRPISTVAICTGAGGSFITDAARHNADAYITGDIRYHDFVDWQNHLLLVDIGHYESEIVTRDIFEHILRQDFPELRIELFNQPNSILYL